MTDNCTVNKNASKSMPFLEYNMKTKRNPLIKAKANSSADFMVYLMHWEDQEPQLVMKVVSGQLLCQHVVSLETGNLYPIDSPRQLKKVGVVAIRRHHLDGQYIAVAKND